MFIVLCCCVFFFFFFKQKTAYEMRISDWSSDVCSSDLADGETVRFGTAHPGFPDVSLRFADAKVPRDIVFDPRLGAAECFMDGRLLFEQGEIMDLADLLRANAPWDKGGEFGRPGVFKELKNTLAFTLEQVNSRIGSRKNVAHHYDKIGRASCRDRVCQDVAI